MVDVNEIMQRLYAAFGTDSGVLLGISPDKRASVRSIIEFTILQMSIKGSSSGNHEEFVNKRCRFEACRIRTHCINLGRVCAAICQDNPVPNDIHDRSLLIVFDDNPTLVKAPDVTDVWTRQYKRWLNLTPPERTYDVNLRIIEKSKFLSVKEAKK